MSSITAATYAPGFTLRGTSGTQFKLELTELNPMRGNLKPHLLTCFKIKQDTALISVSTKDNQMSRARIGALYLNTGHRCALEASTLGAGVKLHIMLSTLNVVAVQSAISNAFELTDHAQI